MICTACMTEIPDGDLFCEHCGVPTGLPDPDVQACPCVKGAGEVDEEGFCQLCGRRVQRPASDHVEQVLTQRCAVVSDRGLRHDRNEDRFAVAQTAEGFALVVCDGVSSTRHAEDAAGAVSTLVCHALVDAMLEEGPLDGPTVMRTAFQLATESVAAEASGRPWQTGAPSTTVVAALLQGSALTVGWAGDSRAYWVTQGGATALTADHSWLHEVVDAGRLTPAEASAAPQAHAITRWVGADAGERAEPDVLERELSGAGLLLLCTDGFWNYADTDDALAEAVSRAQQAGSEALTVARALVEYAKEQGGHDNVTVAVLQLTGEEVVPSTTIPATEMN